MTRVLFIEIMMYYFFQLFKPISVFGISTYKITYKTTYKKNLHLHLLFYLHTYLQTYLHFYLLTYLQSNLQPNLQTLLHTNLQHNLLNPSWNIKNRESKNQETTRGYKTEVFGRPVNLQSPNIFTYLYSAAFRTEEVYERRSTYKDRYCRYWYIHTVKINVVNRLGTIPTYEQLVTEFMTGMTDLSSSVMLQYYIDCGYIESNDVRRGGRDQQSTGSDLQSHS